MRLTHLINSTFLSLKIIVDTLIGVGMRMFQSVSGHSSERSTAHYSSRPTVLQLKGVSNTISNWFENHRSQRTKFPPSLTLLSKVFRAYFLTPAIFKATFRLFESLGCSDDKNLLDLSFSSIFFKKSVDFAAQFFLRCEGLAKLHCCGNSVSCDVSLGG